MKTITKIAVAVASISIMILSIIVASVAWFTSNPEVDTSEIYISSAPALTVEFDPALSVSTGYCYGGQKGDQPDGDDAPYIYDKSTFGVTIATSTDAMKGKMKLEFAPVTITSRGGGTISNVLISDLFAINVKLFIRTASIENAYVLTGGHFVPYVSGDMDLYTPYLGIDGNGTGVYDLNADGYMCEEGSSVAAKFDDGTYVYQITYAFLPAAVYEEYKSKVALSEVGPYVYSTKSKRLSSDGEYIGIPGSVTYNEEQRTAITSYVPYNSVTKYEYDGDSYSESSTGNYIMVDDEYVLFSRYTDVNGFPYSDERYMGATYSFDVACMVEEEE